MPEIRLTPDREKHLRENWKNPLSSELWTEIDALRKYVEKLKVENRELIADADVLRAALEDSKK